MNMKGHDATMHLSDKITDLAYDARVLALAVEGLQDDQHATLASNKIFELRAAINAVARDVHVSPKLTPSQRRALRIGG